MKRGEKTQRASSEKRHEKIKRERYYERVQIEQVEVREEKTERLQ